VIDMMKGTVLGRTSKAKAADHRLRVLRAIERRPRMTKDLRDDLAARCGSQEMVTNAIRQCVARGLATGSGKGAGYVLKISASGLEELARSRPATAEPDRTPRTP
jgi:SOS response regulatory protein OraA/RecX